MKHFKRFVQLNFKSLKLQEFNNCNLNSNQFATNSQEDIMDLALQK